MRRYTHTGGHRMNLNRSPGHVGPHADLRLFEAIVEQTPDAIIFTDCDGMIWVGKRGADAGCPAAEVEARDLLPMAARPDARLRPAPGSSCGFAGQHA